MGNKTTTRARNRVLMLLQNSRYPRDPRVRREATTLVEAGFQVTVISPAVRGHSWHEIIDGVQAYRYPAPRGGQGLLGYVWEYGYCMTASFLLSFWIFVRHGFDVVHAHNPPDLFVFIAVFYKLAGKKFVFDQHDLAPEMYHARFSGGGNRIVHRLLVLFEKLSCRLADHVIATNESYRAMEMDRGTVPEHRISVVRNGPDLTRVRRLSPDAELRERAATIIAYVGSIGVQDGMDYLLRALRKLIDDLGREDFYVVVIGGGDALQASKTLASELGLNEHVWFTGIIPFNDERLMHYLSTADIFVEPSPSNAYTERSTAIKVMEYMALARPIVAFDLREHRFTAQGAALYARPNDELDFSLNISQLMDDSELRREMGACGRERIVAQLAWHHQAQHLLDAYASVSNGAQPTTGRAKRRPSENRSDRGQPVAGPLR